MFPGLPASESSWYFLKIQISRPLPQLMWSEFQSYSPGTNILKDSLGEGIILNIKTLKTIHLHTNCQAPLPSLYQFLLPSAFYKLKVCFSLHSHTAKLPGKMRNQQFLKMKGGRIPKLIKQLLFPSWAKFSTRANKTVGQRGTVVVTVGSANGTLPPWSPFPL